jgi:hypothetical protein
MQLQHRGGGGALTIIFYFFSFTVQSPKPCMKLDLFIYLFVLVGWYFNRTREIIVIVFK